MKNLQFLLFLLVSTCLIGQIPGYKGKKLVISSELLTSIALSYPNKDFNNRKLNFQYIEGLKGDFTISRNKSFGIGYHKYQTGLIHYNPGGFWEDPDVQSFDELLTTYYLISGQEFSTYLKIFAYKNKGALAPVGPYNEFSFHLGTISNKHIFGYRAEADLDYEFLYGVVGWTLGYRNVFFNRIITDIGFRSALPSLRFYNFSQSGMVGTVDSYSFIFYELDDQIKKRGRNMQLLNLKIGMGILL